MSLFQRRHFNWIAQTAAEMNLTDEQVGILVNRLNGTNDNFDSYRFKRYYAERV